MLTPHPHARTLSQMSCTTARTSATRQQPHNKKCMLLGKVANNGMTVSFSHIRGHKMQQVNLHWKRIWWEAVCKQTYLCL